MYTPNLLPAFAPEHEFFAPLAVCVIDLDTRACIHCGQTPAFATYDEYLENWWTNEYEGEPGHTPEEREEFELGSSLCISTPEEVVA